MQRHPPQVGTIGSTIADEHRMTIYCGRRIDGTVCGHYSDVDLEALRDRLGHRLSGGRFRGAEPLYQVRRTMARHFNPGDTDPYRAGLGAAKIGTETLTLAPFGATVLGDRLWSAARANPKDAPSRREGQGRFFAGSVSVPPFPSDFPLPPRRSDQDANLRLENAESHLTSRIDPIAPRHETP